MQHVIHRMVGSCVQGQGLNRSRLPRVLRLNARANRRNSGRPTPFLFAVFALCAWIGFFSLQTTQAQESKRKPLEIKERVVYDTAFINYSGVIRSEPLLRSAPEKGYIDYEDEWDIIWNKWRSGEVPNVDFSKQIVIVATLDNPSKVLVRISRTDNNLRWRFIQAPNSKDGIYGFGYAFCIIDRGDLTQVNGEPLPPYRKRWFKQVPLPESHYSYGNTRSFILRSRTEEFTYIGTKRGPWGERSQAVRNALLEVDINYAKSMFVFIGATESNTAERVTFEAPVKEGNHLIFRSNTEVISSSSVNTEKHLGVAYIIDRWDRPIFSEHNGKAELLYRVAANAKVANPIVQRWVFQLQVPVVSERIAACKALEDLGPNASEAIPALVRALYDNHFDVRGRSGLALLRMGRHLIPHEDLLKQTINDESAHEETRSWAQVALNSMPVIEKE